MGWTLWLLRLLWGYISERLARPPAPAFAFTAKEETKMFKLTKAQVVKSLEQLHSFAGMAAMFTRTPVDDVAVDVLGALIRHPKFNDLLTDIGIKDDPLFPAVAEFDR
jgi:hypothetical protein